LITVDGEMLGTSAYQLRDAVETTLDAGEQVVIIDLSACPFFDSSGAATLIACSNVLKLAGKEHAIVIPAGSRMLRTLNIWGIDRLLPFAETRDEARRTAAAGGAVGSTQAHLP
jgi:anti-anti-sigma factor